MMLREQLAPHLPALMLRQDDDHHKLVVHDRIIALSRAEYVLVLALLQQRERHAQAGQPLCLELADLGRLLGSSPKTAKRLLSKANSKLLAQEIEIVSLRSHGYAIFLSSELAPDMDYG